MRDPVRPHRQHRLAALLLAPLLALPVAALALAAPASAAGRPAAGYCARYDAYEINGCGPRHAVPDSPVGHQLSWVLDQLAGGAATLTVDAVRARLTPGMQEVIPAEAVLDALRGTLAEHGPLQLVGFSYPPRPRQAVAVVRSAAGLRAAVGLGVAGGRIDTLEIQEAPPTIVPKGRFSGWFDVGGRRLFLRCTGTGSPTVVFENGLTSDWQPLQDQLSATTRVCSYDPARQAGPWGRSDPAPAPRSGLDRVRDLHALLAAARVPGPIVLAGHSNGGLFSLLYASRYPGQVAGLVLVDGVHPAYHMRSIEVLKRFAPPDQWDAVAAAACDIPPVQIDAEQMDICRAEAQTRAALAGTPVRPMPLAVLSHGNVHPAPGTPEAALEQLWVQLQNELAALVPGSTHVVATQSGHDIQHDQPALVAGAVTTVVSAVRAGRTTTL